MEAGAATAPGGDRLIAVPTVFVPDAGAADLVTLWSAAWSPSDDAALRDWETGLREATGAAGPRRPRGRLGWLPVAGGPAMVAYAENPDPEAVRAAIAAGRSTLVESAGVGLRLTATDGPRSAGPGERLPGTRARARLTAEVTGAPGCTLRLHAPGGVLTGVSVPDSGTAALRWSTPPWRTPWARAEVRRGDTMVALSNPVFLERV